MPQDEPQSHLRIDRGTPRSIAARMAMMTMNDLGHYAQSLPAALAGRSDEWVCEFAKRIVEIHEEVAELMGEARASDNKEWKSHVGETFEDSVQSGKVPGGRRLMNRGTGAVVSLT